MATVFSREQWEFIVRNLAQYVQPETIVAEFNIKWKDTRCTADDLAPMHPNRLPADWRAFFDAERAAYLDSPTKHRDVRVALLNELVFSARARNASFTGYLEQIAREMSDAYAPRGPGGKVADPAADKEPIARIERVIIDPKESEASEPCES